MTTFDRRVVHAVDCDMDEDCTCGAYVPATREIVITVFGKAEPQGSARAFMPKGWQRPVVTSDNKNLKTWRTLVAQEASLEMKRSGSQCITGPVQLVATFYLPRPKSLRARTPAHTTKPDLDKLTRSIGDSLSGVLYTDDSLVTRIQVTKAYAAPGEAPHAVIVVTPL